jgi:tetratricopeptide (TPR) repeat protein
MASSGEIEKLERRWAENQLGLTFAPLAEAYRKAGDPARALLLLQAGMSQHPNYIPGHIVRGRCFLDMQSDGEAELCFLRVTELDSENVIALKSLAEISERAGHLPEAIRRLELLIDIDRNNEEARGQLDRVREVFASVDPEAPAASTYAVTEPAPVPAPVADLPLMESLEEEPAPAEPAPEPATPAFASEYQLRNDAETLLPSDDRLEDVLLATETELDVPEPAADAHAEESFVLSTGDFSSVMAYEPPPLAPEAETAESEAPEPEAELPPEDVSPVVLESAVPIVDGQPPPPPVEAYESEPSPPVPDFEDAPESEETDAPVPAAEPELVVTETMAEIFLRQGHRELALAVYTQLSLREPGNDRIAAAAAALQQELTPPAPPPPPPEPEPTFAAEETGGRSVHAFLGSLLSASRPTVATAVHPPAFESPRRPLGEPTRPAHDALSLSAVFGDEAAPAGPASAPPDNAGEPSFDEFFAPGASAESELPKPPGSEAGAASQVPEDLEQFNAWLRGLKR